MRKCIFLIFLISFSCSDLDKEKQLENVLKLTKEVSGINQEFEKLKIDSIPALKLSTYEVERRIKQNYFSDTINLEFGQKMDDYKRMRRMLDPIGKEEFRLHQSINEELSQLKKLHFDISNAYGKRESYDEYIQFEKNKVSQINVLFGEYVKLRAQFLEIYDRLHRELLEYGRGLISQQ